MRHAYFLHKTREYVAFDQRVMPSRMIGFHMISLGLIPSSIRGSDNISKYFAKRRELINEKIDRGLGL